MLCHAVLILLATSTWGQEGSVPIEVGSSRRVGGGGITDEDRARTRAAYAPEEPLTEANLPPPGDKKRIPSLHELAQRNVGGGLWKDACRFYDMIKAEGGTEAILKHERGKVDGSRSYLNCANAAFAAGDFDRAEMLLTESEKLLGDTTSRHRALRWKMLRDQMREKANSGDVDGAVRLHNELQSLKENEDERVWLGEQLARLAWEAHEEGDELRRDHIMGLATDVSPMNTELRRLEDQLTLQGEVLTNIAIYGGAIVLVIIVFGLLSRWRAAARVGVKRAPRNKFIDDDI